MGMDTADFTHRLEALDAEAITRTAARLRSDLDTTDGEVAWWRATIAVKSALRRHHSSRQASLAAHRAASTVVEVARAAGLREDLRNEVTTVARAASEVARMLVAGEAVPASVSEPVLNPWHDVLIAG